MKIVGKNVWASFKMIIIVAGHGGIKEFIEGNEEEDSPDFRGPGG